MLEIGFLDSEVGDKVLGVEGIDARDRWLARSLHCSFPNSEEELAEWYVRNSKTDVKVFSCCRRISEP